MTQGAPKPSTNGGANIFTGVVLGFAFAAALVALMVYLNSRSESQQVLDEEEIEDD